MNRPLTFKLKIVIWLSFFGLLLLSLFITEKSSQSFHFVDEDDHLAIGNYINQGYKLYRDISTNHQPLVYILSSLTQQVSQPSTLFLLVKQGRESVFLFSFFCSLFLIFELGPVFLFFLLFFELTKFFIFGNLLLAESLVIYPLIFIISECFKALFYTYKPKKINQIIFGLANFLIIFNLLPLIPSLLFLDLIYVFKTKKLKYFTLGFILPTLIIFLFIPITDYLKETIIYNLKYAIPLISPIKNKQELLQLVIFPFQFFFKEKNSILHQLIQFFSLLTIVNFIVFLSSKKIKKFFCWLFFLFIILLLNTRNINVKEVYYYSGFHLLPWYGGLIFFNLLSTQFIIKEIKGLKRYFPLLLLLGGGIYFLLHPHMPYFAKINKDYEHNVNYLSYYLVGQAILSISQPQDRLAVLPDEELIYWQSKLRLATRQTAYYNWQYQSPLLRSEMDDVFFNNPPEFVYADFDRIGSASYLPMIIPILKTQYWQATVNGVAQNLHIKRTKIKTISEYQWQEWQKLSFDRINLDTLLK